MRNSIWELADNEGLSVIAAGTHPFSSWRHQEVSPFGRYPELARFLQDVGRRLLVFGLHIHIGIEDRELMIAVMNQIRSFLPLLLALSTSSPFWHGRDTGLKSYRTVLFEDLPRTGLPPWFPSHKAYRRYVNLLLSTSSISDPSHIWWDVRPSEKFPTLEIRIPDMCTRVEETVCLAALVQAIVAKLIHLHEEGQDLTASRRCLIEENKWRALRFGIDDKLIDFSQGEERPVGELIDDLVEWLADSANELGSRKEIDTAHMILQEGTSADRQLAVYRDTGNLEDVVDWLIEDSAKGL